MKYPEAKVAVDKEWEKLENLPAWHVPHVMSKKKDHPIDTKRGKDSSFWDDDGLMSVQNYGVGAKDLKIQRSCGSSRWRLDWWLWLLAVFTE